MDAIIARIKAYALIVLPAIGSDANLLDFIIGEVVDSALTFMNREQFVNKYEADLIAFPPSDSANDQFWSCYDTIPIPKVLERKLANAAVGVYKTMLTRNNAVVGTLTYISDNGQEQRFNDTLMNFFNSSDDATIFSGALEAMKKYRVATVIENPNENLTSAFLIDNFPY